jgi:hypothetical protein
MGMGKSLSLLSLMLETLLDGNTWAEKKRNDEHISGQIKRHTHSTLIIVPSACMSLVLELPAICGRLT